MAYDKQVCGVVTICVMQLTLSVAAECDVLSVTCVTCVYHCRYDESLVAYDKLLDTDSFIHSLLHL